MSSASQKKDDDAPAAAGHQYEASVVVADGDELIIED
jgi:hypothetical protein